MLLTNRKTAAAFFIMVLITCLFLPLSVCSQENQGLDEILSGFEEDEKSDDDLQEVIDGFEDRNEKEKTDADLTDDEILEGFEDETNAAAVKDAEKGSMPNWLSIDGYFKISTVYSYLGHNAAGTDTNWHGLTRLRSELKLELDADLSENWQARVSGHGFYDFAYAIDGRDNYTDDVLDNYEKELEFDEVYLQGNLTNDLDLKAGRQIVVWGRSDNIRITDVLNPLDLRWPGLVDIEKLRLPVTMTKLDYYFKDWGISGIAVHEVRYNRNPEFGSDFFRAYSRFPVGNHPDEGFAIDNTQFAASLNGSFRGGMSHFMLLISILKTGIFHRPLGCRYHNLKSNMRALKCSAGPSTLPGATGFLKPKRPISMVSSSPIHRTKIMPDWMDWPVSNTPAFRMRPSPWTLPTGTILILING